MLKPDMAHDIYEDPLQGPMSENDAATDRRIVRAFPWILAVCVASTVALAILWNKFEFWAFMNQTCVVFALAFAALGVWASARMEKGPLPIRLLAGIMVVAVAVAWIFVTGSDSVLFLKGLESLKDMGEGYHDGWLLAADLAVTLFVMLAAPIGVLATLSAMLRKYMPGVLLSVETGNGKGKNAAARFFMVPKIIDADRVELVPEEDSGLGSFLWLTGYSFGLGVLVCSMLFLNPVILETVPDYSITRMMIVLSIFLPAMVVPWLSVKETGARVVSGAPRPYYLWLGARQKLFTGFAALGLFFFSFLVSVYYGNTVETILGYYSDCLVPLAAVSLVSGLSYANCYSKSLRDGICEEFDRRKTGQGS